MTAKLYKFPPPNMESHPVPNNVEEAKKMVDEHFATNSFNILLLIDHCKPLPANATRWQRLRNHWPFQNRWQVIGISVVLVGHLIGWSLLYSVYKGWI